MNGPLLYLFSENAAFFNLFNDLPIGRIVVVRWNNRSGRMKNDEKGSFVKRRKGEKVLGARFG